MKKLYASVFVLLFVGLLIGCTEDSTDLEKGSGNTISIIISQDNGSEVVAEEEIVITDGAILMEVLEENFDVEKTDQGFITSIEGIEQDQENGKFWLYEINGEEAMVGANEYELSPNDAVVFDLHAME